MTSKTTDPVLDQLTDDVRAAVSALLDYARVETMITHLGPAPEQRYIVIGNDLALQRLCRTLSHLDDSGPGLH